MPRCNRRCLKVAKTDWGDYLRPLKIFKFKYLERLSGGESGIRTRDTVPRIHTFQACAFNHSATSPSIAIVISSDDQNQRKQEGLSNQVLVAYQKSPCGAQYSQNTHMFNCYLPVFGLIYFGRRGSCQIICNALFLLNIIRLPFWIFMRLGCDRWLML